MKPRRSFRGPRQLSVVSLSGAECSRRIPLRYLHGSIPGSLGCTWKDNACAPKGPAQVAPSVTCADLRQSLRRSRRDYFPALLARFRTEIDNPIRAFDDLEIVFDHYDRVPGIHQPLEKSDE